jgi:hypothetical protein
VTAVANLERDRLQFVEDGHAYTLDGRRVPAVSDILSDLWKAEYFLAGPDAMERARQVGTAVHLATHLDFIGKLDRSSLHPVIVPFFEQWLRFRDACHALGIVIQATEIRTFHAGLGYAGTLDIEGTQFGEPLIADTKTGTTVSRVAKLQTAGYAIARASHRAIIARQYRRGVLQLRPDKWRFVEMNDPTDLTVFQSLIAVHHWSKSK